MSPQADRVERTVLRVRLREHARSIWRWLWCLLVGCPPTTVVALRHADVDTSAGDPALNAAGQQRAEVLRRMLTAAGVDAIYASTYTRTQQTAAPLAVDAGLTVQVRDAGATAALAEEIRSDHRGRTVVVVGPSNTVPALLDELGVAPPPTIGHDEFDDLFWLSLPSTGRRRLHHLHYGSPT